MATQDALFATLIEGLAELNRRLKEEEATSEEIILELKAFEDSYQKEIKIINDRLDDSAVLTDRLVKEAIAKLPQPKDGKDFNPKYIEPLLKIEIEKLTAERALETKKIRDEIIALVSDIELPRDGLNGVDGANATDIQVSNAVTEWINSNIDILKGEKGEDGKSIRGLNGKSGEDGRSIDDVTIKNNVMTIHFSDGTTKEIKLPRITKYVGGSGSSTIQTALQTPYDNSDSNGLTADTTKEAIDELSFASGGVSDLVFKKRTELESMFQSAYATAYSELTYIDGSIDKIDVWELDDKLTHLFTKQLTYTSGNISKVVISNITDSTALTKDIFYDVDGNITSTNVA